MSSINPFRRQQPNSPTLRQRAASLKNNLSRSSRGTKPNQASASPTAAPATDTTAASILARIARHRLARNRWTDAVMPADRAWRLRHDLDVTAEAMAAAEVERDTADALVTATWNSLFEAPSASSAELLALLRHAQHYVDEDHAPNDAIELSGMVRAIGDAVEALRDASVSGSSPDAAASPDRFLIDLAPTLMLLLDEADAEWAKVHLLYQQAEAAGGKSPEITVSETEFQAHRDQFDVALVATGYKAAWEAIQPLYERIEAMVGPLMNVPVQTLNGLILKQRIGQTLSHFEDDAAKDLAKLAKAYHPTEAVSEAVAAVDWRKPPPGFMAHPAIEPQCFLNVREGIRLELARLRQIALTDLARRTNSQSTAEDIRRIRRDLHLDALGAGDSQPMLGTPTLFDRDLSKEAFDYARGLDLSPVPFGNLLRLYELFARTADPLSDAAQEKQFWVQPLRGYLTAGGIVIDAEQNRLACLRDACAAELQRRKPETESDRDAALVVRLTHEMLCEAKIRDRSLIAEISKAWGG